jgi:chromosome transmission fidelity protein 18
VAEFSNIFSAFKVKLEAATQMKSVSEKDKRPNCLIIDEIDGAPTPTIQVSEGHS